MSGRNDCFIEQGHYHAIKKQVQQNFCPFNIHECNTFTSFFSYICYYWSVIHHVFFNLGKNFPWNVIDFLIVQLFCAF